MQRLESIDIQRSKNSKFKYKLLTISLLLTTCYVEDLINLITCFLLSYIMMPPVYDLGLKVLFI
jgi:hypothetical protein